MTHYEFTALHRALCAIKAAKDAALRKDRAEVLIRLAEAEAVVSVRLDLTHVEG